MKSLVSLFLFDSVIFVTVDDYHAISPLPFTHEPSSMLLCIPLKSFHYGLLCPSNFIRKQKINISFLKINRDLHPSLKKKQIRVQPFVLQLIRVRIFYPT